MEPEQHDSKVPYNVLICPPSQTSNRLPAKQPAREPIHKSTCLSPP